MDAAQNFQVVLRYLLRFGAIGDVFAQIGEHAADIPLRQRLRAQPARHPEFRPA